MILRVLRVQLDRAVEIGEGLLRPLQAQQGIAKVVVGLREIRLHGKSAADEVDSLFVFTHLYMGETQKMKTIEVAGLLPQDLLVERLRTTQFTTLMEGECLLKCLLHGERHGRVSFAMPATPSATS